MNSFYSVMQIIQQYRQIKQNPNQLANLLREKGMISEDQIADVSKMGGHYGQVGQFLIGNGKLPQNYQQYGQEVNNIQNMLK